MPIFKTIAQQKNSNLILSELCPYPCDLMGQYQNENKSTAYTAIQFLKKQNWKISEENISNGLNNVQKTRHYWDAGQSLIHIQKLYAIPHIMKMDCP